MNIPKELYMTRLRDRSCTRESFRMNAHSISSILAYECLQLVTTKSREIQTPIGVAHGLYTNQHVTLVIVLRSGTAMLSSFLNVFPAANIGVVGLKRDEQTGKAHWYYKNIPSFDKDDLIVVLDPMIATGGTMVQVLDELVVNGAQQHQLITASIIASTTGITTIEKNYPDVTIISAAIDPNLNAQHYIDPGLGDFGDRYFGTL